MSIRQGAVYAGQQFDRYKSPDIWVDDYAYPGQTITLVTTIQGYTLDVPDGYGGPVQPNINSGTTFMGLVRNEGVLPAKNVVVNMYLKQPLSQTIQTQGCGASSDALGIEDLMAHSMLIKTETFPEILPGQVGYIMGDKSGFTLEPLEIMVEIEPVEGELNLDNNQARETYTVFRKGITRHDRHGWHERLAQPGMPQGIWNMWRWKCPRMARNARHTISSIFPASGFMAPGETVNFNLSSAPSSTANPGDACDAKFSVLMPLNDGTFVPVESFWF